MSQRRSVTLALVVSSILMARGGAEAQPFIGDFAEFLMVSSRRVSRTVTELEYRVPLHAGQLPLSSARATVTSLSGRTTIVDGELSFGAVAPGGSAMSLDTITFRHDRLAPFDDQALIFTLDLSPVNRPPIADAGPDQTAAVTERVTLDGSASADPDGDLLSYHWTFVGLPPGSTAFLSDPAAVMPTFDVDLPGSYVVRLVVSDGSLSSPEDLVTIGTANSPPVASAGFDQTVRVTEGVVLDGSGSSDVDGDLLSFQWTLVARPTGSGAALFDATSVSAGFDVDLPGTYVVQLVVNDGLVDSAPDAVTIDTENSPPVADAGSDATVFVTDVITISGAGSSDVDNDALTYRWSFTGKPVSSTATLSSDVAVEPRFTVDLPGTYVIQLVVNDGTIDSAPDSVTLTTENSRPLADPGASQTVSLFDTVVLDGSASDDVDGDPLTFSWSFTARPAGSAATLDDPSAVTPSFVADAQGSYVVQLIVNDGALDSVPKTVVVTTSNSPPLAHAGFDRQALVGATVVLDGSHSTDVDSDPLSYQWTLTSIPAGSAAVLADASSVAPSFVADAEGDYVAELVVNDGALDSDPDSVRIRVVAAPLIHIFPVDVGGGLSYRSRATLAASEHGGVTVRVASSDPSLFVVSLEYETPGSGFLDVFVPDGESRAEFVVQGLYGARGTATLQVTADGFAPASGELEVVEPAVSFSGLADDTSVGIPHSLLVQLGVPNGSNTGLSAFQAVSAANTQPLEMTFDSSDGGVGVMSFAGVTQPSVPYTLLAGELLWRPVFHPIGAGATVVSVSVPGFAQTSAASKTVTVAAPFVTPFPRTIGSGLQFAGHASLAIASHGGVTVRIASENPAVALVAPDTATPGSSFIDVFVPDGSAAAPYVVQGVLGAAGTVEVTASAAGFSSGAAAISIVPPGFAVTGLSSSTRSGVNDTFTVLLGVPNGAGTGLNAIQGLSAANPSQPALTYTSSDAAVGQLTKGALTGPSITYVPAAQEFQIGAVFNALSPGTTVVSVGIGGFIATPSGSFTVTVTP